MCLALVFDQHRTTADAERPDANETAGPAIAVPGAGRDVEDDSSAGQACGHAGDAPGAPPARVNDLGRVANHPVEGGWSPCHGP